MEPLEAFPVLENICKKKKKFQLFSSKLYTSLCLFRTSNTMGYITLNDQLIKWLIASSIHRPFDWLIDSFIEGMNEWVFECQYFVNTCIHLVVLLILITRAFLGAFLSNFTSRPSASNNFIFFFRFLRRCNYTTITPTMCIYNSLFFIIPHWIFFNLPTPSGRTRPWVLLSL
jgi:hypothetical protein